MGGQAVPLANFNEVWPVPLVQSHDVTDHPFSAAALPAVEGYDDSTGVGSPNYYIQSF